MLYTQQKGRERQAHVSEEAKNCISVRIHLINDTVVTYKKIAKASKSGPKRTKKKSSKKA